MDKALVDIGLVIKPMVLAIPVITVEFITRLNARPIVARLLKDGKQPLPPPTVIAISENITEIFNHNEPLRYHVPRSWLYPTGNLLVVLEEWGGDPTGISMVKRLIGSACADISEWQPSMRNWHTKDYERSKVHLYCSPGQKMTIIKFASFGTPNGVCGSFSEGSCHAHGSYDPFETVRCCHSSKK